MKKSKSFEDLNIKTNDSSEEIILDEFIKNINSHIDFLRISFPIFFENIFAKKFVSEITKKNINSNQQKTTILIFEIYLRKEVLIKRVSMILESRNLRRKKRV